jgi:photosystem II stability/assembly factor-like uncharacterized protein
MMAACVAFGEDGVQDNEKISTIHWRTIMKTNSRSFLLTVISVTFTSFAVQTANAAPNADLMHGLQARTLGPAAMSGRISTIDVVASDPNRIIVGAGTGGVWMSENGGLNWEPVFDDQPVASIGAIAINQTNPDIIWVGTGESNVRNSTSIGGGIYKSVDGGETWALSGLANSERIDRIALHPTDSNIVYVAAMGTLWGPNEERGIYKTTDGGATWKRTLYVDQLTGATDIKMDPSNPDKLYAGMWQFRRWPYQFKSGGPGSGMYISNDAGKTWEQRTEEDGLPEGELGRMVFGLSAADPKRVYALVEADTSALLVSNNGGQDWEAVNEDYNVADRPFYYTEIAVDPNDANHVYNIATNIRVSIDGGRTFEQNPVVVCCDASNTIHIDNHAFWINPDDSNHLIAGSDGGIAITRDRGETWRFVRNLPLAQFYHIAVDNDHPYHIYGGLQDNGSWRGPSEVWENAGIRNLHWQEVGFGDGFDTLPDPENSRRGYVMSQGGFLFTWNLDTGEQRMARPQSPAADIELRFNWNAGIAIDPFDSDTVYYGSQFLHKSTNRGATWTTISGDLTTNNPDHQLYKESGGLTYDVTAAENYTTIFSVALSKLEQGLIWVGTDDGRVHVTRDGGQNWNHINARVRGLPDGAWVAMITPSPHTAGTAFITFDDHRRGNMNTYVYRVDNYGERWTALQSDDVDGYALSVLQDPVDPDLLFLGTEFGLYVSLNAGDDWFKFTAGVPTVSVMDMAIQVRESDLVLGTHGRAIFVIDDYSALRNLDDDDLSARFRMLSAGNGQHYAAAQTPSTRFTGTGEFRADNEAYGALLTFVANGDDLVHPDEDQERLRLIDKRQSKTDDDTEEEEEEIKVTIEVEDADGDVIRSFEYTPYQGINRIVWDMRRDGVRDMPSDEEPETDVLPAGAEVPPGRYRITLSLDGTSDEVEPISTVVDTVKDPRSPFTQAEIEQNHAALLEIQELEFAAVRAMEQIVRARDDVATIKALIGKDQNAEHNDTLIELSEQADTISTALDDLESLIRVPHETTGIVYDADKLISHIGMAQFYVGSSRGAPTAAARSYMEIAERETEKTVASVNDYLGSTLVEFRDSVSAAGIGLLSDVDLSKEL